MAGADGSPVDTVVLAGRYRLIESIGQGGTSEVWRAEDAALSREVAVKIWRHSAAAGGGAAEVWRDGRDAARLVHPSVARVYDMGADGDQLFLVTELVRGRDLGRMLVEHGPLPTAWVAQIGARAARVLAAAHAEGLVHGGLKPGNVLAVPDGSVKLTDFGTAASPGAIVNAPDASAAAGDGTGAAANGHGAGRGDGHGYGDGHGGRSADAADAADAAPDPDPDAGAGAGADAGAAAYVSPEQAVGLPATPASDLYALGCVLYELLIGRPPFTADGSDPNDPAPVLRRHVEDTPVPPGRLRPGVPAELEHALLRMLAKNPADRPAGADRIAEVFLAIEAVQSMADD